MIFLIIAIKAQYCPGLNRSSRSLGHQGLRGNCLLAGPDPEPVLWRGELSWDPLMSEYILWPSAQ